MDIKCRACLATTEAKMYHSLLTVFPEYTKTNLRILDLLGIVTSSHVNMSCSLPDTICTACLKQLKDCYKFIRQFKDAQSWLHENYGIDLDDNTEQIIIKFENVSEKYTASVVVDSEGRNIGLENLTVDECKKESIVEQEMINKKLKLKTTSTKVRVKRKPITRQNVSRSLIANDTGIILMSINDVLRDGESIEHHDSDNLTDTVAITNDLEENKEDIIHIDHSYQKTSETATNHNRNPYVMSINDVLAPTRETRGRKRKTDQQDVHTFLCEICSKVYDSRRKLIAHKWNVHIPADSKDKCKCPFCGVICRTRSAFNHHKLKHTGKSYRCDECGKSYLTPSKMREHKRLKHGNPPTEKHLCNTCGLQFKYKTTLTYHLMSRHNKNNKLNICRYCGFRCIQKGSLKRHERCHTDERPYECKYCDKKFRGSGDLGQHELIHEGKFKYACTYCGKGFLTTWNMKVHWLQHRGNYGCEICQRSFIDGNVLKFHYFQQHKIRDHDKEAIEDISTEEDNVDAIFYEAPTTAEELFMQD